MVNIRLPIWYSGAHYRSTNTLSCKPGLNKEVRKGGKPKDRYDRYL